MTDIVPAIDLAEMRRHIERLHRHAEAYGAGSLKLVSSGLDPQQPRPLPLIEHSFPIGGIDPMAEAAMRLNRRAAMLRYRSPSMTMPALSSRYLALP